MSAQMAVRSHRSWMLEARLWAVAAALLAIFVLDIRLPEIVLLPFLCVPVVAAATFAGPIATG